MAVAADLHRNFLIPESTVPQYARQPKPQGFEMNCVILLCNIIISHFYIFFKAFRKNSENKRMGNPILLSSRRKHQKQPHDKERCADYSYGNQHWSYHKLNGGKIRVQ